MNPTAQLLQPEVEELVRACQYAELRDALHGIPPADVADILSALAPNEAAVAFRFLPRDDAGEVFAYMSTEKQEELIKELGTDAAVRVVDAMSADDRARLIDELPSDVAQRLVASLPSETRKETQAILGYPPKTVGRLMSPDYVSVRAEWTIPQALEHIRRHGRDAETINVVYVVDEGGRLIDDIRLRTLFLADPSQTVESLMTRSFIALRADQPQSEAVDLMSRYDRIALPVVDSRGVLIGIVTVDDVQDVAQAQFTEDIQKLGGMQALESDYLKASLNEMVRKRGFWLAILLVCESMTILVMGHFQDKLDKALVLALFVPLIIASGGNSGSQAASLVVRALALKEVEPRAWSLVLRKELVTGLALGSILGVLSMAIVLFWQYAGFEAEHRTHAFRVAFAIGTAIVGCVIWGTFLGSMFPLLLKRLGLDPATASSPMVATIMDSSGLFIYFTVAVLVLSGTVL